MAASILGTEQWVSTYLIPLVAGGAGGILTRLVPELIMERRRKKDECHQWYSSAHTAAIGLLRVIEDGGFYDGCEISDESEEKFEELFEVLKNPHQQVEYVVVREGSLVIESYDDAKEAVPDETRDQDLADRLTQLLTQIERVSGIDSTHTPSWRLF